MMDYEEVDPWKFESDFDPFFISAIIAIYWTHDLVAKTPGMQTSVHFYSSQQPFDNIKVASAAAYRVYHHKDPYACIVYRTS
jgi:hypothetical protein